MGNNPRPAFLCEYFATKKSAKKRAAELRRQRYKVTIQPAGGYRNGGWLMSAKRTFHGRF